jgi:hypothetical protein
VVRPVAGVCSPRVHCELVRRRVPRAAAACAGSCAEPDSTGATRSAGSQPAPQPDLKTAVAPDTVLRTYRPGDVRYIIPPTPPILPMAAA